MRPWPRYQFVWWLRLQFWFVRDEKPLGFLYLWRASIGPLEVRRWNPSPLNPYFTVRVRPAGLAGWRCTRQGRA